MYKRIPEGNRKNKINKKIIKSPFIVIILKTTTTTQALEKSSDPTCGSGCP